MAIYFCLVLDFEGVEKQKKSWEFSLTAHSVTVISVWNSKKKKNSSKCEPSGAFCYSEALYCNSTKNK